MKDWIADKGDLKHRLTYDLTESSLVFDVGGYLGNWSVEIFARYNCEIFVFEPIVEFCSVLAERFRKNKKVVVFNFGLSAENGVINLYKNKDSTSKHKKANSFETVQIKSINDFITTQKIEIIDLIKINIEGGEYDLLKSIIRHDLQHKMKNIQIQFHKVTANFAAKRQHIQEILKQTHKQTYCYDWVWENWELR